MKSFKKTTSRHLGALTNKFHPIHPGLAHSLAHLSHNRSAAAVTNSCAAQADGLFARFVSSSRFLLPRPGNVTIYRHCHRRAVYRSRSMLARPVK